MENQKKQNYIDGQWVRGSDEKRRDIINPATGQVIDTVGQCSREDTMRAIKAAKKAFYQVGTWRRMDAAMRSEMLLSIADGIEKRSAEIAEMESINQGKPLREAEGDVADAAGCFRYYAGLIRAPHGGIQDVNGTFGPMHSMTVQEPVGVCGLITPWNYPILMAVWKLAPALAAGNTVVFKPASVTPLTSILLFEIMEDVGLPKGTANLVLGGGSTVGQEIAENKDVDMVAFTGSTSVGKDIARAATVNVKKVGLELGGKSPNIIFADADMEGAVEWAMIGIFFNAGQICSAGSRILVEESIKNVFLEKFQQRAEAVTIGNPLDNPDMGPLVSKEHMDKVLEYIRIGKKEGAKCICGGERYTEGYCEGGYFVKPTIFDNCTPDMRIFREEIFGPVVTVTTFKTEQDAVDLANDTDYGLAGMVFSTDGARALRVVKELRAGITWINCNNPCFTEAPWGGYKMSGMGRELGIYGLEEYRETKQITINLNPGPVGWYR